ncbi:MAG TPA: DUF5009 domain-containing protein [Chitinophagaceae bacterium]|nr:DUF5009 domain-containing protein [Chitinophagaceae bacterium]
MQPTPQPLRLASIDVLRAITMFLMIFVNDLGTLKDIPVWLEHTKAEEDGMGLADTIFPAFLFIVGLSLPFALMARQAKGASHQQLFIYILTRSLALLVMGFFQVNLENYHNAASLLPKPVWQLLITIGFFLVWLDYPSAKRKANANPGAVSGSAPPVNQSSLPASYKLLLQGLGIALLIAMAVIYKGREGDSITWMRPRWWGILGLIGWAYLLCATLFLLSRKNLFFLSAAWLFFLLFNIAAHAGWLTSLDGMKQYVWIAGDASMPALTMSGVVSAIIYQRTAAANKQIAAMVMLAIIGALMIVGGFCVRPLEGISKIRATPAWVMICTGISLLFFVLLIYIADIQKKKDWFAIIKPAGTSTLTCYLLPYVHYAIYTLIGVSLPLFLRTGGIGIVKSLVYSLLIILIAGVLEKWRIRLRL